MADAAVIRRALLRWYRANARDLPWRRTRDPYAVWLSEVLLQQTRIETALPYYKRFIAHYPAVRRLAEASVDDVLTLWSGLGYYSRARNFLKAARIVAFEQHGAFPRTVEQWRRLPGIGAYTAAAIASIVFNEPVAAIDGNVKRVLARLFAIETSIDTPATQRQMDALANTLISRRSPGDFNQAMMELGARVCLPRNPHCDVCLLRKHCRAAERGIQHTLPARRPKNAVPRIEAIAGVLCRNGCLLLLKRPPTGLLAGLWQLPTCDACDGVPHERLLRDHMRSLLGVDVTVGERLGQVTHAFSHRHLTLHVYACETKRTVKNPRTREEMRWVSRRELEHQALASVDRKALALL